MENNFTLPVYAVFYTSLLFVFIGQDGCAHMSVHVYVSACELFPVILSL